ncbi:MAG: carboxyl-terminal processing protease, partial [Patescibacteria group bacterium]|nr:carboxyl-terminal processing protease [Patescibacteria group bacterium]
MEDQQKKHIHIGLRTFAVALSIIGVFFLGVYVGFENRPSSQKIVGVINKEPTKELPIATDFEPFWKAWALVQEKYPDAEKTTNQEHVYGAIKGMLASFGDPYTTFFTPEESKMFESEIAGEFGGVGMELGQKDGILTVIAPLKDTPASRAGILSGDKIVKIDDTLSADIGVDKAIDMIRGEPGTSLTLTIVREGLAQPKVIPLTRAKISIPTVDTERREAEGV